MCIALVIRYIFLAKLNWSFVLRIQGFKFSLGRYVSGCNRWMPASYWHCRASFLKGHFHFRHSLLLREITKVHHITAKWFTYLVLHHALLLTVHRCVTRSCMLAIKTWCTAFAFICTRADATGHVIIQAHEWYAWVFLIICLSACGFNISTTNLAYWFGAQ